MAIAESNVLARVREYISKVTLIFSPIFFAVLGARLNLWSLSATSLYGMLLMLAIAIISLTAGAINQDVYAQIVAMAAITTIMTPILLRRSFGREPTHGNTASISMEQGVSA